MEASAWPASTHLSMSLPSTYAPMNPPAKASPAPFVSTICELSNFSTGYTFGLSASEVLTRMVEFSPCVKITVRGREALALGRSAMALAIAGISLVSARPFAAAHASASDSLPMIMSQ